MSKQKVTVISPVAMEAGQLEKVGKMVSNITKSDVLLENEIDKKLLGGIIVKFGTLEIDLSTENIINKIVREIKK